MKKERKRSNKKQNIWKAGKGCLFTFRTHILDILLGKMPEGLFGNRKTLENLYERRYWRKDTARIVAETRKKTAASYFLAALLTLFLIGNSLWGLTDTGKALRSIVRPDYGEPSKTERLTAELRYENERIKREVALRIAPRVPGERELQASMKALAARLPTLILGENPDLAHVTASLHLPLEEPETGILIEWVSDTPTLLGNDGQIDTIAAEACGREGQLVKLTAFFEVNGFEDQSTFLVRIRAPAEANHETALKARLAQVIAGIEKGNGVPGESDSGKSELSLAQELSDGTKIIWKHTRRGHTAESLLLCACLFAGIFFSRYRKAKREVQNDSTEILRDLPDFMNRFVLLLSAGLVTEAAVKKIAADYRKHTRTIKKPLFEGFCEIERRIEETNASFLTELHQFAKKSGVRELIRLSTLLEETIHTGTALNEKLETEAALLWFYRKKNAEEKGRLAETRLTFPLVIQLLVLMLITLAPVFLKL